MYKINIKIDPTAAGASGHRVDRFQVWSGWIGPKSSNFRAVELEVSVSFIIWDFITGKITYKLITRISYKIVYGNQS